MITINQLYSGIDDFCSRLDERHFVRSARCLVKIFTPCLPPEEAVAIARKVKHVLPNAAIIGASAAGIIFEGRQYEDRTMVLVEEYEHLHIKTQLFSWAGKTASAVAQEVHDAFPKENAETVHILFSDRYYDVNAFVNAINDLPPRIRMAGGVVGDLLETNTAGYLFTEQGVHPHSALAFTVTGGEAVCFIGVNTAQEPISPVFHVTGTKGSLIETIEGEPADQWMYRYLALDEMRSFDNWESIADNDRLIRFQMILEGHGTAGRFTRYDEKEKALSLYFSRLEPGTAFRIGYTNPSKCVRDCYALCQKIMDQPMERMFIYTCLFRKLYMSNSSKWELLPLAEYAVCGVFMMGEIGFIDGQNEFYNGSCLATGIAERKQYIMPNISALDNFIRIQDDAVIMDFAMRRQKETKSEQEQNLLNALQKQSAQTEEQMYVDSRLRLSNVLRYKEDCKKEKYDKLCMAQIENDDMLIAYAGLDAYLDNTQEIIGKVQEFMRVHHYEEDVSFYCVTQSIFFFAGKESVSEVCFERIMRKIYKNFHFYKSEGLGLAQMARFVLVLQQKDMLQGGLNALQATKDVQSHFVVCDEKDNLPFSYAEELRVIELLNYAVCNDGVVPYYQGIRNNKTGEIHGYEALMRLRGADGIVYCPDTFISIAKRYRLYFTLSQIMIEKVLRDFAGREEDISINLSSYDINAKNFSAWFFAQLETFPHPERIMVELVESEDFRDTDVFSEFVRTLRAKGCKIAVDDFGTGYSSLEEVIRLEPDILKVDGGIISRLENDAPNMVLLRTIIFLARQLQIQTVAEGVETEATQRLLEAAGVDYTQGFLFAKPEPLEQLETERDITALSC